MILQYEPADTTNPQHPTWDNILEHCGFDLDDLLSTGGLESYGIWSGQDYLTSWIASMTREPGVALPYLFFYGNQNCGKSAFREAVDILFKTGSVCADQAAWNLVGWNGELEDAFFCYLEEVGFGYEINDAKAERLRGYVTQPNLLIHIKGKSGHKVTNLTHWCQMSNRREDLPDLGGYPTTVIQVFDLENEIPKGKLLKALKAEAPHFMKTLMDLQLPQALPAIITGD